jgi:hypothetical protein
LFFLLNKKETYFPLSSRSIPPVWLLVGEVVAEKEEKIERHDVGEVGPVALVGFGVPKWL